MPRIYCPMRLALVATLALAACQDDGPILPANPADPGIDQTGPLPPTMRPHSMGVEGYPEPGESRQGFIYDRAGLPLEITYEVHDGLAIWQGDIILGGAHDVARTPSELSPSIPGPLRGAVIDDDSKRWPGGVIPYTITDATPSVVMSAIDMIQDQTPGVTLVPRTSESNYVTFQDATGCSSSIGMQGGQQFVNLKVNDGVSFCSAGNAAHEILHTLGMYHEHTRCDRDAYVVIHFDQIQAGKESNFFLAGSDTQGDPCGDDQAVFDVGDYDIGSIMHYPANAFAIGALPTITAQPGVDASNMGQRSALGPTDQETIDLLYGDFNAAPVADIAGPTGDLLEGSALSFDASGSSDADDHSHVLTFAWSFGDGTCGGGTPPSACSSATPDHTYADDGNYAYSVTVSDGFDAGSTGSSVNILNVAPGVDAGDDATIDEGDTFVRAGSFTDPGADTWTATVDYDDGGGVEALTLAGKSFTLEHTYADNDVNTVDVTVDDDDGGSGSDAIQVTVNNVPPAVDAGPDVVVESGQSYDFSGSFSDPGVLDAPWSWVIQWGFGSDANGQTNDQASPVEASRQVCVAGDYTVTFTVTDKDDGVGSDDLTLTVPYVSVMIDILPGSDDNPFRLNQGGTLPVAILGSADLDVSDIDASTLTLGDETDPDTPIKQNNNGTYAAHLEDVNNDGFMDLVVMFPRADLVANGDVTGLSTELVLRGFEADACTNLRGSDVITPIGG